MHVISAGINLMSVYELGGKWCVHQGPGRWAKSGPHGQNLIENSKFESNFDFKESYEPITRQEHMLSFISAEYP